MLTAKLAGVNSDTYRRTGDHPSGFNAMKVGTGIQPLVCRNGKPRTGSLALELLLVLPVFLALLLGMIEFSLLLSARQDVLSASRQGVRVAALGGTETEVRAAVNLVLGPAFASVANIEVTLTDSSGEPILPGEPVQVTVELPADSAAPDLLRFIGFSLEGEAIVGRAVMLKE
jgi:hypothetical protein